MEPSSRQASGSPSGARRVHRQVRGSRAEGKRGWCLKTSWEGALSIRNDKWISSAPGLNPSTFQCAEALQFHGMMEFLCAGYEGPAQLPSDPTQSLSVSGAAEGLREAQRQDDVETNGER